MADNNTTTRILEIQVRYQDAINQIAKYRKSIEDTQAKQKELKKALKDGTISQEEYGRQFESSRLYIQQQNQAIGVLSKQIQNQEKAQKEALGSIAAYRAELSNLTAEYDRLSQTEREGAKGQELKNKINEVTDALKDAENATQRYFRNVGNYPGMMNRSADSTEDLIKALETESKTAAEAKQNNEILRKALAKIDPSADGATEAMNELNKKIDENNKVISESELQSSELVDNLGDLVGVNTKFGSSLELLSKNNAGSVLEGIGVKAKALWKTLMGLLANPVVLTFLGIAAAGAAVKWWYDYNKGLEEASRLTRQFTGLEGDEMKAFRNEVQAIGDQFGHDFNEVLQSTNALSQQMGISMTEALQLVKDGFIAGGDAGGQFLDMIGEYPAYFNEAGVSASQFVAITAQASKSGVVSDKAVDSIKEANIRLREMTDTTKESLSSIGLDATKIENELANGTTSTFEVMQQVSTKLSELPPQSKAVGEAITNIFGGPGEDAGLQYLTTLKDIETNLDVLKDEQGELGQLQEEQLNKNIELENAVSALFDQTGGGFEKMTTQAKIFFTDGLISIIKGIIGIINYFIDLYNESIIVRGGIESLVNSFKTTWEAAKFMIKQTIAGFKGLGGVIKAVFDFDIKHPIDSMNRVKDAYTDAVNGMVGEWKTFTNNVKNNTAKAFENVKNGKVEHITYDTTISASEVKTEKPTSITNNKTGGNKDGDKDKTNNAEKEAEAVKKAKEEELKYIQRAEDELLKLINSNFEKRRQTIATAYDREIGDLKLRLAAETSLTEEQKEALNAKIGELEQKKQDEIAKAEAEMLNGTNTAYEMQRQAMANQYDRQIEELRNKLATEKNLTEESKKAINSIITSLEQQKQQALDGLLQEQLNKDIEYRKKMIELELSAVKEGSEQSYQLKLQQLEAERELELNNVELTQEERTAIEEKYRFMRQEMQEAHDQEVWEKQQESIRARYETALGMQKSQDEQKLMEMEMTGASESQLEIQQLWDKHAEEKTALAQMQDELLTMRQEDGETSTEFEARQAQKRQEIATQETKIKQTQYNMQQSAMGGLRAAIDAMGEHSKAFAVMSKVIALGEIAINTGKALAAGIAQAQSVPFPGNIAAIATTVATILANIATAISTVKSAKFAQGGKVNGAGTGTSDSIPAMLSNGEFVMTARATKMFEPLLMAMNNIGSGVPMQVVGSYDRINSQEVITSSFTTAVQDIHPIVSVVEITDAQNRVTTIESLDTF